MKQEIQSRKYKAGNTKQKIQSRKYKAENTKHKIRSTKYKTQNMKHKISNKPVRIRETKAKGRAAAGGGGGAKDCANDFCAMERRLIYEAHRNVLHNGMSTTFASAPALYRCPALGFCLTNTAPPTPRKEHSCHGIRKRHRIQMPRIRSHSQQSPKRLLRHQRENPRQNQSRRRRNGIHPQHGCSCPKNKPYLQPWHPLRRCC